MFGALRPMADNVLFCGQWPGDDMELWAATQDKRECHKTTPCPQPGAENENHRECPGLSRTERRAAEAADLQSPTDRVDEDNVMFCFLFI